MSFLRYALLTVLALPAPASAVTLIYSNDVLGELEPCGCRNNPTGGLPRKGVLLDQQKDELLQLDAGDLLFETDIIPGALAAQRELQARKLAKAHVALEHDAVVPGEKDFALGVATFDRIRKESGLRFLAANLKRKDGRPFLEDRVIFKKKMGPAVKTIGVFGLVGENLNWPAELRATAAIAAAHAQVKNLLAKKVDFIIALTHQGYEKDLALAKAVPKINLIVGGHSQSFLQQPDQEGRTVILQSSFRNQYVGVVSLDQPITAQTHKLIALDESYEPAKHPTSVRGRKMAETVESLKKEIAALNEKESAVTLKQMANARMTSLHDFQTFPRCAECHVKQFDFWRKTQHTRALETLIQAGQHKNKDCLSCHTLGLGDPKGFQGPGDIASFRREGNSSPFPIEDLGAFLKEMRAAEKPSSDVRLSRVEPKIPVTHALASMGKTWSPVQCENCHGAAGGHPFSVEPYAKAVATDTCLKCHTAERAPSWYQAGKPNLELIANKRAMITCPPGDAE